MAMIMMSIVNRFLLVFLVSFCSVFYFRAVSFVFAVPNSVKDVIVDIDWPSFLQRSDPVWSWTNDAESIACLHAEQQLIAHLADLQKQRHSDSRHFVALRGKFASVRQPDCRQHETVPPPSSWLSSSFVGNGNLGAMLWLQSPSQLNLDLSRTDVYDTRSSSSPFSVGNNFVFDRPRLPIGHFFINLPSEFNSTNSSSGSMRINLWDAEITASLWSNSGAQVQLRLVALADVDAFMLSVNSSADDISVQWVSAEARSTWTDPSYVPNPPAQILSRDIFTVAEQTLLGGGGYSTVYTIANVSQPAGAVWKNSFHLFASISPVLSSAAKGTDFATNELKKCLSSTEADLLSAHRSWWNAYYPQSFFTWTDSHVESFYWIQMYKLASGTRSNKTVFDLQGPWFVDGTDWPDTHWDLNIQLTYSPLYTANRLQIAESLVQFLERNMDNLIANVPVSYRNDSAAVPATGSALDALTSCYWDHADSCLVESPTITGNLLWTMQLYYFQWSYSMDDTLLQPLYALLRRAVNLYTHMQSLGADGFYHLPITFSPEYPGPKGPDTNYDLALYKWALQTLLDLISRLKISDPNQSLYESSFAHLVPFPTDSNGYMVSSTVPFSESHRHYSHLFMIFPLSIINWDADDTAQQTLTATSVDHWIGLQSGLTGFARVGASSMSSLMGRNDAAYSNITFLLQNYIQPNTMYNEGGSPCGETPPAAAASLQDMVLLSGKRKNSPTFLNGIEVFPGWSDLQGGNVTFHRLRAEGGLLVSAARQLSRTLFIRLECTAAGQSCVEPLVLHTDMAYPFVVQPESVVAAMVGDRTYQLSGLQAGIVVVLYSKLYDPPALIIQADPGTPQQFNSWGSH